MKNLKLLLLLIIFVLSSLKISYANDNYLGIKYGISQHDLDVTVGFGTVTSDDDDEGFIISGGSFIGDNWGVDLMYYDLGSSSIFVESEAYFRINKNNYKNNSGSAGTITNDISGYGAGIILSTDRSNNEFLGFNAFAKLGAQAWEKSGTSTILDNDKGFAGEFYNQGIGAYGGVGIGLSVVESLNIDLSYDIIGLSNKVGFDNSSTLFSAGIRFNF